MRLLISDWLIKISAVVCVCAFAERALFCAHDLVRLERSAAPRGTRRR